MKDIRDFDIKQALIDLNQAAIDHLFSKEENAVERLREIKIKQEQIIQAFESKDKWIDVNERLPDRETPVIGYFPCGDESGAKVAGAIRYGKTLHSDAPNSTAHCFIPTHWMPLPNAPDKKSTTLSDDAPFNPKPNL